MMKTLRSELKRSFCNRYFLISLFLSGALVTWYSVERIPFCVDKNNHFLPEGEIPCDFLEVSFTNWLGSHTMFLQQQIFFLILPLLAVIPFAGSFYADLQGGYAKNVCVRTKKSHYLISKYIAVFISGGAAGAIPLVFSFLLCAAFLPSRKPEVSYLYTNIFSSDRWSSLLFTHPLLYVLVYCGVTFLFAGLTACMALGITYFSSKSFLPMLFPFFVYLFESMLCELLGFYSFSVRTLITADAFGNTTSAFVIMAALFFAVSFFPYYFIGVKKDVL